jgi:2-keto-4-pentenoate hydratase/2-oxohepta-3-ene-1,7-dioic acid hydratase in catechol pathway
MKPSRSEFLAGAAGAAGAAAMIASPTLAAAASPREVAAATAGMTLTTLRDGGVDHLGIRTPAGIIDVAAASAAMGIIAAPFTVDDVVAGRGNIASLPKIVAGAPASAIRDPKTVEHGPLVGSPPKIICVGLNYSAHLAETGEKAPPFPDLFNKYNTTLNRHKGTINVSRMNVSQFDYESELVMIIGKTARNVPESEALNYVYGYTTGNDFTARDAQMRVSQWMTGKTPDEFAPLGPWLVTADQIPDPQTLQVQTFVNDETTPRQDMNTSKMIFSCAHIVAYTSSFITLQPGDVIFTGTPSGVIVGMPPDKRVWLKPGDRVRTVISKLGELRFSLV